MDPLKKGDQVPHFEVTDVDGGLIRYADVWQHKHLLLVVLSDSPGTDGYIKAVKEQTAKVSAHDVICVVTRDSIAGIDPGGVVMADRWGEVQYVVSGAMLAQLPPAGELLEWLEYVQHQCPECQGEAR